MISLNANAQVVNAGVGGNNTLDLLERLEEDVLIRNPDIVILMIGTNDMLNARKMIPYKDYEKNVREIVGKIKANGCEVVLMSSPPVDSIYLFERHDKKLFTEGPNVKLNKARKIISLIADSEKLKYLDLYQLFSEMNLPKHNEDLFFKNLKNSDTRDGVHPTDLGYQFIGTSVFYFLKENNLLTTNVKIICFGDSITRGGGKENTYPVILQKLIKI